MARKIELRGVIVPSSLDSPWLKDYIDKGVIVPESRVRQAFKDAGAAKEPVELYINSPGGSVFAGYEIANAANEYLAGGGSIDITLGALAASAAANIVAAVPASKVRAHANSKLMFHGAWGMTEGGAEAHGDTAGLLAKINAEIVRQLTARYKLTPDQVSGWFAEGREGWLTAAEAKAAGMVDEIVEESAPILRFKPAEARQFAEAGIAIAACAVEDEPPSEPEAVVRLKLALAELAERHAAELADAAAASAEALGRRDRLIAEMQSERDRATAALAKCKADGEAAQAKARADIETQAKANEAAIKQIEDSHAAKIAELETRVNKLLGGALHFHADVTVGTWEEAVAACDGDYVGARRQYPAQYAAFMARPHNNPKG